MTRSGVSVLQIRLEHVLRIEEMKSHHGDPFDRMLIAQSLEEGWPIVSADAVFRKYPVRVIW
jgi:PIN domain nuclease of toxin-antitoxin system